MHLDCSARWKGITTAAVLGASLWLYRRQSRPRIDRRDRHVLTLLESETSMLMLDVAATSTVTFATGDHAAAAAYLRQRLEQIVAANPWLSGRLDKQAGDVGGAVLVYGAGTAGDGGDAVSALFTHCAPGSCSAVLRRDSTYEAMSGATLPLLVKTGNQCVGRADEPLFRVSVVPDAAAPAARWALVVSLSHVIADGHTFYAVHNMLSDGAPIVRLEPRRKPEAMAAAARAMGGEAETGFLGNPSAGMLVFSLRAMLLSKVLGPAAVVGVYALNEAFVAARKAEAASDGVPFVSTNDVIQSTLCRATRCDVGTMHVNFRGRIAEGDLDEQSAGNYEDMLVMRPPDFASPALVRRSISPPAAAHAEAWLKRAAEPATALPTMAEFLWGMRSINFVSNWSTFARVLELKEGCGSQVELHLPLVDAAAVPARGFSGCFVFRSAPGAPLGLCVAGSQEIVDAVVRSGLVGDAIV